MSAKFETFGVDCPRCGTPLLRPKHVDPVTGKKMRGACPAIITYEKNGRTMRKKCGYMEPVENPAIPNDDELTIVAHKNDALSYLNTFSVLSDFATFKHRFSNYLADNDPERQAMESCKRIADDIIAGKTVHSLLLGKTGRGKTHLAVGMIYYIMERTGYKLAKTVVKDGEKKNEFVSWKIMFVDWRELISLNKQSFNDDQLKRRLNKTMAEMRIADVVVLDDFGSERSTDYSMDLSDKFWRDREDKTVITTSNLVGNELEKHYGARLFSRMKHHGVGNSVAFGSIKDYRGTVN